MALWDFLKRKKEVEKAKDPSRTAKLSMGQVKQPEKVEKVLDSRDAKATKTIKTRKDVKGFSYQIVREPHISEKSTNLAENNKYVFKVYKKANKPEIKKSIEGIYGVDVVAVNVIKVPAKKRRLGRTEGFKKGYNKAVVTIKEGQKIEIL